MPRDLNALWAEATDQTLDEMPGLSEQPTNNLLQGEERSAAMDAELSWGQKLEDQGLPKDVKVYSKALTLSDLEACCVLEDAAFPPEQRCSRKKFEYRLTVASELCHGLFTTASEDYDPQHLASAETAKVAPPVETFSSRKQILIAHAIGTLSTNEVIRDDDMALPPTWKEAIKTSSRDPKLGHKPEGRTAMLHSLAVLPSYQGKRVGSTLLKHYIDLLRSSGNYDRLALLADESHVDYYVQRGFENLGKSEATFGGVAWYDLAMDFEPGGEDEYD